MITIQENVDLTSLTTFGIKSIARYFTIIKNPDQLKALLELEIFRESKKLVLGGGSNILFTKIFFDGFLIKNEIVGIEKIREDDDHVWLKVGAGEGWHSFVMQCVEKNFGGVENLSLIPGSVGAAPMQNIGAYGVEVKDTIESVHVFDFSTAQFTTFSKQDCHFGYRESIFKQEGKHRYFITHVTFQLTKRNHVYRTDYGAVQEILIKMKINELSLKAISDAIIDIRVSKLPDPARIGNAGSFFKNPTITLLQYQKLKKEYANMPMYVVDDTHVKIPAGWLIEQCGWKGKTIGKIGVHTQQALVLVNYGGGDGAEIFALAQHIQTSVEEKFNILLHMEVNII
jgi:UDP-N-acetylmuramate dehydrogenase